jgi:hypothetical protein
VRRYAYLLALILAAAPQAGLADSPALGRWRVTGTISGHDFTLDCRFTPAGAGFGGSCTEMAAGGDMGHPGKVHALTSGTIAADRLTWAYPVSAMLMKFDMTFEGKLENGRMTGIAHAAGRTGSFTATR